MHMNDRPIRLRQARANAGFENATEAAKRFGWTISTYLGHENGSRGFKIDSAREYARAFKVSPEWLMFGGPEGPAADAPDDTQEAHMIDVYDVHASAGYGALVADHEEVIDRLSFPPEYLSRITKTAPRHLAIIGVKGDSMEPTLRDDDVVMIDTTKTSLDYDGLFVLRWGDALHVKRVGRATNGSVRIISDNGSIYPAVDMERREIAVVGKVVWMGKKV